ncbi:MAG: pseudouridine synthase, partial [Planctomycetales bacterium]|nr:pseudouridine synthase [Planctomycetales bacterium]
MNAKDLSLDPAESSENSERLNKVLATAGIASRRECDELIEAGRVEVDGEVVSELGFKVDPRSQEIRVDGDKIRIGKRLYYAFYKPDGVLCTNEDPDGRSRVIDWIPTTTRIYTVGRLDRSSEGLIVVTNDGTLAQRLTHPKFGVEKTYDVTVVGHPTWEDVKVLLDGVRLAEGWAKVKKLDIRKRSKDRTQLRIVLDEGKNREIRRLLARIGHKVVKLVRVGIGRLALGLLQPGEYRELTVAEIKGLENLAAKMDRGSRDKKPGRAAAGKRDRGTGMRSGPRSFQGRNDRFENDRPSRDRGGRPTSRPGARDSQGYGSGERRGRFAGATGQSRGESEMGDRRPRPEGRGMGERRPRPEGRDMGERRPRPEGRGMGERRPRPEGRDMGERRPRPEGRGMGERRPRPEGRDMGERRPRPEGRGTGERR